MENQETTQSKRPVFLTVLCILTMIGSGWSIVDAITDYSTADTAETGVAIAEEIMDDAMDDIGDSELTESQEEMVEDLVGGFTKNLTADNIRKMAIFELIAGMLTLMGAILMWNLRKIGYYSYIGGFVLLIVGYSVVFGGLLGALAAGAMGFIGVVFIVLYGINLKHMH